MRKSFAVILLAFILMTPLLASCATTADTDAPSSPPADQSPSPTAEAPPSEDIEATASAPVEILEPSRDPSHAPAQMNAYVLTFGGAEDEFFSAYENTDRALDALEPLLFPAVWAALDAEGLFHVEDDPADARFKWTTVYHMIKDYTSEKTGLTQSDGNFIVTADSMGDFFLEAFEQSEVPDIPPELSGLISCDAQSGDYTLNGADGGGMIFVLRSIALSLSSSAADGSRSASLQFDVLSNGGTVDRTLAVEVRPSEVSSYHYSILAAYPVEISGMPNPMRESSAQEILDTLGLSFAIPDRAEDVAYHIIDMDDGTALAQAVFTLDGTEITYRIQPAASFTDISGVYEDWTTAESVQIQYGSGEAYCSDSGKGVCLWYDAAPGLMYSVYMSANADIDTLAALAGELFVPMQGDA